MPSDGIDVGDGRHENLGVNDDGNDIWIDVDGNDGVCVDGCGDHAHVHVSRDVNHGRGHAAPDVRRHRLSKISRKIPEKTP